jgi:hypothetical protein
MNDTATVDAGPVLDTQAPDTDNSAPQDVAETQAAPKAASLPSAKELLKREKDDPNYKFTNEELDILDKHFENEDNGKSEKAKPAKVDPEEDEDGDKPEKESKETVDESEEDAEPEEESDNESNPEMEAVLKEVGAKSLKDAAAKIKQLKALVGGKDAQAVARLTKEKDDLVKSGQALWSALAKGDQKAIAFAEKTFGVKFGGQGNSQTEQKSFSDRFIDPDKFIDPESADLVESAFQRLNNEIKELKSKHSLVEEERDRHIKDTLHQQSVMSIVDEMASIASKHPALKGMTGFRDAAKAVLNGKDDPRLEVFNELFDIAKEENCSLKAAYDIKRGRESDFLTATAKQEGLKLAYKQKPNPSLSGLTGGRGETAYQPVTPAQLEKWESDHSTHPASWYDKDDNLVQSKVPRAAWKIFGFR